MKKLCQKNRRKIYFYFKDVGVHFKSELLSVTEGEKLLNNQGFDKAYKMIFMLSAKSAVKGMAKHI